MHFVPFWIVREGPRNNFHQRSATDISPIVNFYKVSSLLAFWLLAHMHILYIIYYITFQIYTGILFIKKGLPLMFGQVTNPYQQHMNCYQTSTIYTRIYHIWPIEWTC